MRWTRYKKTEKAIKIRLCSIRIIKSHFCLPGGQQFARIPQWMKRTQSRIVGGDTAPDIIPWQVHVHYSPRNRCFPNSGTCSCGGTILNENTILSAAHCFYPFETADYIEAGIKVEGSSKGQKIDVIEVILHPLYNSSREVATHDNDIAILKLEKPLTFNGDVLPASLPDATLNPEFKEEFAYVSGWGTTSRGGPTSKDLKFVSIPILEVSKCVNLNSDYTPSEITTNMICAGDLINGGEDSCQGDSGGPMVTQYSDRVDTAIIYGIVSWGNGCAQQNGPGMYTRVSNYNTWIQSNMNKKNQPKPNINRPGDTAF
jgi:secreted trypsin-like serine protease